MVRIYANLAGLSKTLAKHKLAGPEKRSLSTFVANFTRSNDLFDFVDAGELKENADFKIRAMLRQFVENAQCKQIYFAGCHDVGYINDLTPHVSSRDRITLVRAASFHPEFSKLGMRVEEFNVLFRKVPLEGGTAYSKPAHTPYPAIVSPPASLAPVPRNQPTNTEPRACYFFQKGVCKYGKNCQNLHIKADPNGASANLDGTNTWRRDVITKSVNEFINGHSRNSTSEIGGKHAPLPLQIDFATILPLRIPAGKIALSRRQHRLDEYVPPHVHEDRIGFTARAATKKLCNTNHVIGYCAKGISCEYDHTPITPGMLNYLKQIVRGTPCPRKGNCRTLNCCYGHICQRADCKHRGGGAWCKFPAHVHAEDLHVANFVDGITTQGAGLGDETTISVTSEKENSSVQPAEFSESSGRAESDEGECGAEGALLDVGDDALGG